MGTESLLVGSSSQPFKSIEDAIENLEDTSRAFLRAFARQDFKRAGKISLRAFECFDHLVGELMRLRDDRKAEGKYAGTPF